MLLSICVCITSRLQRLFLNSLPDIIQASPGPGCSKLTTSLVNILLKFQTLVSQICQYFFVEKI